MTIQLEHPPAARLVAPSRPLPVRPVPPSGLTVTIELSAENATLDEELLTALDAARGHIAHLGSVTVTVRAAEPPATVSAGAPVIEPGVHLHIYPDSRVVRCGEAELPLSRLEFDLLLFLAEHPGQVFSRSQLLASVWGDARVGRRTIDVHVRRLRAKIDDRFPLVTTIRGVGYRFDGKGRVSVTRS